MKGVCDTPALRDAYNACLPMLSELSTWMGQHQGLYQAYKNLVASDSFNDLTMAQQKVLTDAVRDFELAGVGLSGDARTRYGEIRPDCPSSPVVLVMRCWMRAKPGHFILKTRTA